MAAPSALPTHPGYPPPMHPSDNPAHTDGSGGEIEEAGSEQKHLSGEMERFV